MRRSKNSFARAKAQVVLVGMGERMAERFLPIYIMALGGSAVAIGLLQAMDNLLSALYSFPGGYLSDRIGTKRSLLIFNLVAMVGLTMLFKLDFLRIQWVGALVIALYFGCFGYILLRKRSEVAAIQTSPKENILDFRKIELAG